MHSGKKPSTILSISKVTNNIEEKKIKCELSLYFPGLCDNAYKLTFLFCGVGFPSFSWYLNPMYFQTFLACKNSDANIYSIDDHEVS